MSTPVTRRRFSPSAAAWVLLAAVALGAVATVSVMVWAFTYGDEPSAGLADDLNQLVFGVLFVVWALVPFVAMAAAVLSVDRWARGGRGVLVVLAVGVAALEVPTVVVLADFVTSDDSTAGLIFIFLPFYQLVVVAVSAAAAFGLGAIMRWRRARRSPAVSR